MAVSLTAAANECRQTGHLLTWRWELQYGEKAMLMVSKTDFEEGKERIGVVGLGYVGLPLAALLATKYDVLGFDINSTRIAGNK